MPALGMNQDTGKVVRWLKAEGDEVNKGEPIMEIETDKVTVEIEAEVSGILSNITAAEGEDVPVGHVIAKLLKPGESPQELRVALPSLEPSQITMPRDEKVSQEITATPIAARIAAKHKIDLKAVKPQGGKVSKADVESYLQSSHPLPLQDGRLLASPKARRLANERGVNLTEIQGTGPEGVILTADIPDIEYSERVKAAPQLLAPGTVWHVMVNRITQSWSQAPHFYLVREVNASLLIRWRESILPLSSIRISYTDILIKLLANALSRHPRLNSSWKNDSILVNPDINIGLAVAIEEGLIVPVIPKADQLNLKQIAKRRADIVQRANAGKLLPGDIQGGTFTLTNLGMYGIDVFNAVINPPEAAILAVGRIIDRVIPVNAQPTIQPMMMMSLACDHRVVDGARGADFLQTLATLIEEPLELIT
jgi:pyruvate dehydrogenase E2 component (dihydrolipoamide acetyltransferase)